MQGLIKGHSQLNGEDGRMISIIFGLQKAPVCRGEFGPSATPQVSLAIREGLDKNFFVQDLQNLECKFEKELFIRMVPRPPAD